MSLASTVNLAVGRQLVQPGHVRARFEQHLAGHDDLLALALQVPGQAQPVRQAQFVAARADCFAQVDLVHGRVGHGFVERKDAVARPVVLQGPRVIFMVGTHRVGRPTWALCAPPRRVLAALDRGGLPFQGRW